MSTSVITTSKIKVTFRDDNVISIKDIETDQVYYIKNFNADTSKLELVEIIQDCMHFGNLISFKKVSDMEEDIEEIKKGE